MIKTKTENNPAISWYYYVNYLQKFPPSYVESLVELFIYHLSWQYNNLLLEVLIFTWKFSASLQRHSTNSDYGRPSIYWELKIV